MPIKKLSKIDMSKFLLTVIIGGLYVVSISGLIYSFMYHDNSPLIALIECASRLCTIAVGFYYWKAKCENMQKYKHTDKIGEIKDDSSN